MLVAACGGGDDGKSANATAAVATPLDSKPAATRCRPQWLAGWQRLANRTGAPVFCPGWMPSPIDGRIGGDWDNGVSVDPDRSYLVSFLWHEAGNDVHVNFRGYPGSTALPRCQDVRTVNGKTTRRWAPCFSDRLGTRTLAGRRVTVYRVNRDADQWHVVYAWRYRGSLYALSEHVAPPYGYGKVVRNLDRMMRGVALVSPSA